MKFLHTADWHLGKKLQSFSRMAEQQAVLDEICALAEAEQPDMVLIAGDIFDTYSPTAEATELFYRTVKKLSRNGACAVVAIAGNHDSPERFEAPDPLARACGIFLAGLPGSEIKPIALAEGVALNKSEPGFAEFVLPGVNFPVRMILTPFANEQRLRAFLGNETDVELRALLQKRWAELADKYCDTQGVNLLMAHLYFLSPGAAPEPEDLEAEKPILQVGGAQVIYADLLPPAVQYSALGHLHRMHKVGGAQGQVYYSGSPLEYSFAEAGQEKCVVVVEVEPNDVPQIRSLPLTSGRKLLRNKFESVTEAVAWLESVPNALVELTLSTATYLSSAEKAELYMAHDGIVNIFPEVTGTKDGPEDSSASIDLSRDTETLFVDYFRSAKKQDPPADLLSLFRETIAEEL